MSKQKNTEDSEFDQVQDVNAALISAALEGNGNVVAELLLEKGVNPNHARQDNSTALMIAAQNGHKDVAELLLAKGADHSCVRKDFWTALMFAAQKGHNKVAELLLANGADPNCVDQNGDTALVFAVENGHKDVVELLLENGVNPNHAKQGGWTVLMIAVKKGNNKVVELLLENDADPNKALPNGNTALMLAGARNLHAEDGWTALMFAAANGHEEVVELLLANGADLNHTNNAGDTALMIAAFNGHKEVAEFLLANGADLNHTNNAGNTAFMLAAEKGHNEVAELLESAIQIAGFFDDVSYEITTSIDSDFFISVYKIQMLRKGVDIELFTDKKLEHLENIKINKSIPEDVKGKIESLFADVKDNFVLKCSQLFYTITGGKVSPVPLSELISQSQGGNFVPECNEYAKNLIKFYTDRGIKFSIDMENLLLKKIQVGDEAIEALKEEIYVANINILQNNIGEFILGDNEVYVFIRDLITTTILPSSLRDILSTAVENYEQLQANPLFSTMMDKMHILIAEKDALIAEKDTKIEEQEDEIQSMKLDSEPPIKVEMEDHLFAVEGSSDMPVIGENHEISDIAASS